jgi:hypothetical protein
MSLPAQNFAALHSELQTVYGIYDALLQTRDAGIGLGGNLLVAGALNAPALRMVRAATIAGAAVLAATLDTAMLRAAQRDNAINFQVTSLDEALRILKNEIRKQQPVAVAVQAAPEDVAAEMSERGVVADIEAPVDVAMDGGREFLAFAIPKAHALRAAAFDEQLLALLPAGDALNRRWYRAAPRCFGREYRNLRSLGCDAETAPRVRAWLGE